MLWRGTKLLQTTTDSDPWSRTSYTARVNGVQPCWELQSGVFGFLPTTHTRKQMQTKHVPNLRAPWGISYVFIFTFRPHAGDIHTWQIKGYFDLGKTWISPVGVPMPGGNGHHLSSQQCSNTPSKFLSQDTVVWNDYLLIFSQKCHILFHKKVGNSLQIIKYINLSRFQHILKL